MHILLQTVFVSDFTLHIIYSVKGRKMIKSSIRIYYTYIRDTTYNIYIYDTPKDE